MATTIKPYRVLLYYKYIHIEDPVDFAAKHLAFCKELGVLGRILVGHEGINGTISGTVEQTDQYMQYMHQHPLFSDMKFKIDEHDGHAFRRLSVRPRKEIVTWNFDIPVDPTKKTGKRLSPKEFYEQLQRDDVIVIDGRNDFEYDLGHFRNAIRPEVKTTREFPEWIRKNLSQYKDKTILTYCTGGIRCEKLTSFLLEEGFQDVAQLEGGIVTYGKDPEVQGRLFDGKCYVFDDRISVGVNRTEEEVIISKCYHCGAKTDQYVNCEYKECDQRHFCCDECLEKYQKFCSSQCRERELSKAI